MPSRPVLVGLGDLQCQVTSNMTDKLLQCVTTLPAYLLSQSFWGSLWGSVASSLSLLLQG